MAYVHGGNATKTATKSDTDIKYRRLAELLAAAIDPAGTAPHRAQDATKTTTHTATLIKSALTRSAAHPPLLDAVAESLAELLRPLDDDTVADAIEKAMGDATEKVATTRRQWLTKADQAYDSDLKRAYNQLADRCLER